MDGKSLKNLGHVMIILSPVETYMPKKDTKIHLYIFILGSDVVLPL